MRLALLAAALLSAEPSKHPSLIGRQTGPGVKQPDGSITVPYATEGLRIAPHWPTDAGLVVVCAGGGRVALTSDDAGVQRIRCE